MTTNLQRRVTKLEDRYRPADEPVTVFFKVFDPSPTGPMVTGLVSSDRRRSVDRQDGEEEEAFLDRAQAELLRPRANDVLSVTAGNSACVKSTG